jgi:DNA topoisomerase-1
MKYITRKLKNNKYIYFNEKNIEVKDKNILDKISKIYIAPAYENVKIFPDAEDLLAYGYDIAGRKQYVYSENFKKKREGKKYCKLIKLCDSIHNLKRNVDKHLSESYFTKNKLIATIIKMMELCNFRCGNLKMEKKHGTHGVTTIHKKHLTIKKDNIDIEFVGKKGVINHCIMKNKKMNDIVKKIYSMSTNTDPYLFSIINEKKEQITITMMDLNDYLKKYKITSKDLRTWNANIIFIKNLKYYIDKRFDEYEKVKENPKKKNKNSINKKLMKVRKSIVIDAVKDTAISLHHTPAICKSSYLFKSLLNETIEKEELFIELKDTKNIVHEDFLYKILKKFGNSGNCRKI